MSILSESLNFCSNKYNAAILGYVLMPNQNSRSVMPSDKYIPLGCAK
ncbi:hypothetical protein [Candidatus Amoebophilus asiaticus]|nr:hypothetical protein [Candidatus Amoebophilus asiaticus]